MTCTRTLRPPQPARPARHRRGPGARAAGRRGRAARRLRIGDDYTATLAVTGYPAEVAPGWLEPLLSYPGRLDVALHIDPVPPARRRTGCACSGPAWNPGAALGRTCGSSMTRTPKPPQMTPGSWRTGWPAAGEAVPPAPGRGQPPPALCPPPGTCRSPCRASRKVITR